MKPSVVDWTLFVLVTVAAVTGLVSLTAGNWQERLIFYAHGAVGLALIWPLILKFRRVLPRLVRPSVWSWKVAASLLASVAVLATIGTGILWAIFQQPLGYPSGMHLHILFALLLIPLYLLHTLQRFRPVRSKDVEGRRTALRFLTVWIAGGISWLVQAGTTQALSTTGSRRRFTGSHDIGGSASGIFPITNWMLDNPAPVDIPTWHLRVHGAVERELMLAYAVLVPADHEQVVLDCTGGWYAAQDWQGLRASRLLDQAGPRPGAVAVSFKSVTGYRWSLPLDEARAALLATHVGNQPLQHGHGAPVRLVAPGRRGFQWVKWVTDIEVLTHHDYGQWVAIFTSGLGSGSSIKEGL